MRVQPVVLVGLMVLTACTGSSGSADSDSAAARAPVIGGPCEDCQLVYEGMPEKIASRSRIAPDGEPGQPLVIEGVIRDLQGRPASGIIVYAHHTDSSGIYPHDVTRHGRLRGWAKSDSTGHYAFETIRPGAYPNAHIPRHIHMQVVEPGRGTYWISDINFDDDPLITASMREDAVEGRAGNGLCSPRLDPGGVLHVQRDIQLGLNIPDYPKTP